MKRERKEKEKNREKRLSSSQVVGACSWAGARDVWAWDVREAWTWNRGEEECQMGMLQNEAAQPIPSSLPFFPRPLWLPVAPPLPYPPPPPGKAPGSLCLWRFSAPRFFPSPVSDQSRRAPGATVSQSGNPVNTRCTCPPVTSCIYRCSCSGLAAESTYIGKKQNNKGARPNLPAFDILCSAIFFTNRLVFPAISVY